MARADEDGEERRDPALSPPVAPARRRGRRGFLPIGTNLWDRFFISAVCFVAIHLLWMRFLEAHLPLVFATALSAALGFLIVTRG